MKTSIGSLFVILLGVYLAFTGLRAYPLEMDSLVGGFTMIGGALAFRSARERQLGWRPDTKLRRGLEIAAVVLVVLPLAILAAEGRDAVFFYPWSGIVVPLGTLTAFLWMKKRGTLKSDGGLPSIR